MKKQVILDNELITVWYYPERKLIHHKMKATCHGQDFRDALTRGAEAMEQYKGIKWLSDDRLNGNALPTDDETWATTIWFPRIKAAGWRYWAIVAPEAVIGQVNMSKFMLMYAELGISARMFSDPDLAFTWIDGQ
jgi:hypothetical protein